MKVAEKIKIVLLDARELEDVFGGSCLCRCRRKRGSDQPICVGIATDEGNCKNVMCAGVREDLVYHDCKVKESSMVDGFVLVGSGDGIFGGGLVDDDGDATLIVQQ